VCEFEVNYLPKLHRLIAHLSRRRDNR